MRPRCGGTPSLICSSESTNSLDLRPNRLHDLQVPPTRPGHLLARRMGVCAMSKRRGRGEGSVFQRKDGAWCGVVTIGYDATGKRRRRYIYGATKAETLERLTRLQHAKFTGELGEPTRFTVAAYLRHWLETAARPAIRESTYTSYATLIRVHIIPCIGGVALSKLAPVHLEHWLADM